MIEVKRTDYESRTICNKRTGATKKIELKISNIGKTDLKISGATTLDKALRIKKFPKLLKPGARPRAACSSSST